MRLLLDTHVVLWMSSDPNAVSLELQDAMRGGATAVVSVASLWEIALKMAKGKLVAPDDFPMHVSAAGITLLPVSERHAWAARSAPDALRTADPFDRMLHTQARLEGLTLATRDAALLRSGIAVLRA